MANKKHLTENKKFAIHIWKLWSNIFSGIKKNLVEYVYNRKAQNKIQMLRKEMTISRI